MTSLLVGASLLLSTQLSQFGLPPDLAFLRPLSPAVSQSSLYRSMIEDLESERTALLERYFADSEFLAAIDGRIATIKLRAKDLDKFTQIVLKFSVPASTVRRLIEKNGGTFSRTFQLLQLRSGREGRLVTDQATGCKLVMDIDFKPIEHRIVPRKWPASRLWF